MTDTRYRTAIRTISLKELGSEPDSIERMTQGICNENYAAAAGDREYIFRFNQEPRFMLGSREHIPLFRSLGITVPEILAEDYTLSEFPFAFQMQKRIPGRDLGEVIAGLTESELRGVAGEVANVFRRMSSVPNNGKFGVAFADNRDLVPSWPDEVARVTEVVRGWGRQTGVLDARLSEILDELNRDYREYFGRIRPYTYFGDIAGKNVMVHEGRFSGLVDLDGLSQGDPLEAIGRIKSSWYGTAYGEIYTNAVMDALGLPEPQRKLVTMYALLNKAFWTLENGIKFNANTSGTVDRERERSDKAIVGALYAELKGEPVPEAAHLIEPEQPADAASIELANSHAPGDDAIVPLAERTATVDVIVAEETSLSMEAVIHLPAASTEPAAEVGLENILVVESPAARERIVQSVESEAVAGNSGRFAGGEREAAAESAAEFHIENLGFENVPRADFQTRSEELIAPDAEPVVRETEPASSEQLHIQNPPRGDVRERRSPAVGRVMLEASGLSKTYESDGVAFNALRGVDLKIAQGECLAIVGKSGSGKSTLMHLLACLDGPSGGYVYVDGEDTTTMSEAEKNRLRNEKFGFVFQQFFLNGRDSVFENVVLPMRIRGAADFEITTAADEALAAVGLTDKTEKSAKDLSGGEKQRVCIARALIGQPEVIFADEPTGNLDSNTGEAIERLLFDLNRSKGITLIVVTHDPELANRFDRIVEMKDGRIVNEYRGRAAAAAEARA